MRKRVIDVIRTAIAFSAVLTVMSLLVWLSGCTPDQTERHLVKHPKALKAILVRCEKMTKSRQADDPACIEALHAYQQLQQMLTDLQWDPTQFGQEIIQAQRKLVALQQQKAKMVAGSPGQIPLTDKINTLQNQIDEKLAVAGLVGE